MPPPGSDSIASVPVEPLHALAHAGRARTRRRRRWCVEADAVVAHVERHDVAPCRRASRPTRDGRGVAADVGQRLLRRAQQRDLDVRVQRARVAGRRHLRRDAVELRPALRDVGERVGQPRGLQRARARARAPSAAPRSGSRGRAARRCRGGGASRAGRPRACSAASSCVMIPVRPCASVSWISRAIRWRSSSTPRLARLRDELGLQRRVLAPASPRGCYGLRAAR